MGRVYVLGVFFDLVFEFCKIASDFDTGFKSGNDYADKGTNVRDDKPADDIVKLC